MKVSELLEGKKPVRDYSPLGQLKELPQPIGINGGSYTYWVDVTKTPLEFVASDGSELGDECRSLKDITKWMDKWAAELWTDFLENDESIEVLKGEGILRTKKGRGDQAEHEANMREGLQSGQKQWKDKMIEKGAVKFKRDTHGGGSVDRMIAYDKDGKVLGGFDLK